MSAPRDSASLYACLLLVVALALLHFLAMEEYLYWAFWWYDVMMHFLAGFALGFGVFWGLFRSGHLFKGAERPMFMIFSVLLVVFVLGVGWEIFEYVNGIDDSHEGYRKDVINDLVLDSAGAVLAAILALGRRRHGSTKLTVHG